MDVGTYSGALGLARPQTAILDGLPLVDQALLVEPVEPTTRIKRTILHNRPRIDLATQGITYRTGSTLSLTAVVDLPKRLPGDLTTGIKVVVVRCIVIEDFIRTHLFVGTICMESLQTTSALWDVSLYSELRYREKYVMDLAT